MNHIETAEFLEKMQGCFPRISIRDTTIETWKEILESVPVDLCHKAYIQYMKSGDSREPKPGDILAIARTMYKPIQVKSVPCEICRGSGMLHLIDMNGHESVGRCTCENGNRYPAFPIVKLEYYNRNAFGMLMVV